MVACPVCFDVSRLHLDGAHTGEPVYALSNDIPAAAIASTLGVVKLKFVRPGVQDTSPYPKSSERINRKDGGAAHPAESRARRVRATRMGLEPRCVVLRLCPSMDVSKRAAVPHDACEVDTVCAPHPASFGCCCAV